MRRTNVLNIILWFFNIYKCLDLETNVDGRVVCHDIRDFLKLRWHQDVEEIKFLREKGLKVVFCVFSI